MATNVREQPIRDDIDDIDDRHDEVKYDVADPNRMDEEVPTPRTVNRLGEPPVAEPASTVTSPSRGGVAVYERNPAQPLDPTLRPAAPPTPIDPLPSNERLLVEPRSTGSIIGWFIGAAFLVILAYFLLQIIF